MFKFIQKTAEPGSAHEFILKQYYAPYLLFTATSGIFHQGLWNKFIFLMKCSLIMLVIQVTFAGVLVASTAKSQNINEVKVGLNLKGASVKESLVQLQTKSGFKFTLFNQLFDGEHKKVTLKTAQMSVRDALVNILLGTNLRYKLVNEFIVIEAKPVPPKPGRISGKILDEKGEALPGASVRVVETGAGVQSGVDGNYILNAQPGTYTLEITYISFQTQRITGVVVTEDKNTPLNISMKPVARGLKEVVVTSGYKKATTAGLLAKQKNASEISNGISADQLSRTPDKNIGESLKRISGVSTVDNKFVVVRGIGERYNAAQLDGIALPSTEGQTRNFSFDLIPTNMVDNIVVSKTVTPDMNASFGGGLIQISTKDIPAEDFMSFTAGTSYNDQSTGKDFFSKQRGKYDYLGFDDGRRDFPTNLEHTDRTVAPNNTLSNEQYQAKLDALSKKFTVDNSTLYKYKTAPSQNYQFTIGRLFGLDTVKKIKLGFTASLSYRNTQAINNFDQYRSGWVPKANNYGSSYRFNTTLGGLLNVGLQVGQHRFSLRNTYTHLYDNALIRTTGYSEEDGNEFLDKGLMPDRIQEVDDPTFTNLLQNKISGQHQLGKVKLEWNASRTSVDRKEKDIGIAEQRAKLFGKEYAYFYITDQINQGYIKPSSRHNYDNQETHYSGGVDASLPFNTGPLRNMIKTGYFGIHKKGSFNWQIATLANHINISDSLTYLPISEKLKPENMGAHGYNYTINQWFIDAYEGKSINHAGYLMLDNRLAEKLRLVWGVRGEYYRYTEIKNGRNQKQGNSPFSLPQEKNWQWIPSANLTYSPISQLNIRLAASRSVVRPELLDNSQFFRYNAPLNANFGNLGLESTKIESYDFKTEWFPGLGEIISAGAFYKYFDKPTELVTLTLDGDIYLTNSDHAKVYGLEFEMRKNLGFLTDNQLIKNFTVYGNLTLQRSSVVGYYKTSNPDPKLGDILVKTKQSRSMYGQAPYLINAGLQYTSNHFGFNVAYNKSGRKTYIVGLNPDEIEYEKPRAQIDAQVSYRFLKSRFEVKLNAANLLNKASTYYINRGSYEKNPDFVAGSGDYSNAKQLKPGFTDNFEDGDQLRFNQKFGRTYSLSLNYNF